MRNLNLVEQFIQQFKKKTLFKKVLWSFILFFLGYCLIVIALLFVLGYLHCGNIWLTLFAIISFFLFVIIYCYFIIPTFANKSDITAFKYKVFLLLLQEKKFRILDNSKTLDIMQDYIFAKSNGQKNDSSGGIIQFLSSPIPSLFVGAIIGCFINKKNVIYFSFLIVVAFIIYCLVWIIYLINDSQNKATFELLCYFIQERKFEQLLLPTTKKNRKPYVNRKRKSK